MSVIAWDGKTLAADKMFAIGGATKGTTTKIRKINGSLIGVCGDFDAGNAMFKWFEQGKNPDDFPEAQKDKERWASALEITSDGKILRYEREPVPYEIEDAFFSVGSGGDVARGALAMGADAKQAVLIAERYSCFCGNGVDILTLG